MKGIFITGTDTDVGKTWVSKKLVSELTSQDIDVVPRKPVESGWPTDETQTDAWALANAANKSNQLKEVCPNRFKTAISPDRAASLEGKFLTIDSIKQQCLMNVSNQQFLYVEGAGGFYSPLCSDGLNADLAKSLDLPVLLVVKDRLGCINQTLLTIEAIEKRGLKLLGIILNEVDSLSYIEGMDNLGDLEKLCDYPLLSISHESDSDKPFQQLCSIII